MKNIYRAIYTDADDLKHHGVKGQSWGTKNGPPYPLDSSISTGKRLKNVTLGSATTSSDNGTSKISLRNVTSRLTKYKNDYTSSMSVSEATTKYVTLSKEQTSWDSIIESVNTDADGNYYNNPNCPSCSLATLLRRNGVDAVANQDVYGASTAGCLGMEYAYTNGKVKYLRDIVTFGNVRTIIKNNVSEDSFREQLIRLNGSNNIAGMYGSIQIYLTVVNKETGEAVSDTAVGGHICCYEVEDDGSIYIVDSQIGVRCSIEEYKKYLCEYNGMDTDEYNGAFMIECVTSWADVTQDDIYQNLIYDYPMEIADATGPSAYDPTTSMVNLIESIPSVEDVYEAITEPAVEAVSTVIDNISSSVESAIGIVTTTVSNVVDSIADAFSNLFKK